MISMSSRFKHPSYILSPVTPKDKYIDFTSLWFLYGVIAYEA